MSALDPAVQTLLEALEQHPAPTLIWGEGLRGLDVRGLEAAGMTLFTDDALVGRELGVPSGVVPDLGELARVALLMPRAKALLAMRLALCAGALGGRGEVWLAGHQRDGVRSGERLLGEWGEGAYVVHLKRRCRVVAARPPLGEGLALDRFEARVEVPGPDELFTAVSLPGVFGHGRLDHGTERLLGVLAADPPPYKRALDLGAGCGVLGAWLARRRPRAEVLLLDVSELAAEASRRTLVANGLSAGVLLGDVESLAPGSFDLVVSNPPRHEGRAHDHDKAAALIEHAARRLKRGGRLICVANHNREVTRALEASFARVTVRHHDSAYRVWDATR